MDLKAQASLLNIATKFGYLYTTQQYYEENPNLLILFGEKEQKIFTNKGLFSIHSYKYSEMMEKNKEKMGNKDYYVMKLLECNNLDIFNEFIKFLKFFAIVIDEKNVMGLYELANLFEIHALKHRCLNFMNSQNHFQYALIFLREAVTNNTERKEEIIQDAVKKFDKCYISINNLKSEAFMNMDYQALCVFLQQDNLLVGEKNLYQAAINWAKRRCRINKRNPSIKNILNELKDALQFIRWNLMSRKEFAARMPIISEYLSSSQMSTIYENFDSLGSGQTIEIKFRNYTASDDMYTVKRFKETKSWLTNHATRSQSANVIKFKVNRPIRLLGYGLYGSCYGESKFTCKIFLDMFVCDLICAENEVTFWGDGTEKLHRVLFSNPVTLEPKTFYYGGVYFTGPPTFFGNKPKTRIVQKTDHGIYVFEFPKTPEKDLDRHVGSLIFEPDAETENELKLMQNRIKYKDKYKRKQDKYKRQKKQKNTIGEKTENKLQ